MLARVRCYISDEACHLTVLALVVSRLDYCNALLAGASQHQLEKLQRLQNRAARLVARPHTPSGGAVHVTPILQRLHWLPVRQRVLQSLCTCSPLRVWCGSFLPVRTATAPRQGLPAASADLLQRSSDNTSPDGELGE